MVCYNCILYKRKKCLAAQYPAQSHGYHLGGGGYGPGTSQFVRLVTVTSTGQQVLPTPRQVKIRQRRAPYQVAQ
ncbi:MAG: hypothetical protein GY792_05580 [Gammaproteobacteria bacterium]|nr:hypothetical protein [Gammaproteobacteria bacterium]